MATRKADLKKERERAHKPAAGYPVKVPPKDPVVDATDAYHKEMQKPPAKRQMRTAEEPKEQTQ